MAEENQVQQEPQQVTKEPQQITKEIQRVATKDPKKVEAGKRLAAINHKKREAKERIGVNQYYRIAAILALRVIGGLGYYIYRSKKGGRREEQPSSNLQRNDPIKTDKFEMD